MQKLLCAYAFPQCIISDGTTIKLPLCYEDCVATYQQFCYTDWALIEDRKQKGIFFKTRGHFRLPVCDELPRFNRSARTCSYVGLTEMDPDEITCTYRRVTRSIAFYIIMYIFWVNTDDCRMGNGRYYMGTVNMTQSGLQCQKWDVQSPHTHFQPPNVFPQVQNAENYCRNADAEEPYPWCYTMNASVRWQWCDVPLCRK